MKLSPDPIPHGHGIYALIHHTSQSIYIGSSTNLRARMIEWRSAFRRGDAKMQRFPTQNHDDYEFRLLKRTEGMTYQQLRDIEAEVINKARGQGMNVLNIVAPMVATIHELDGLIGSATFHATRLGKNPATIIEKLKRGYTIAQATGKEPAPPPRMSNYDHRNQAIAQMPIKLIAADGSLLTYAETGKLQNRSAEAVREWVKRQRKQNPTLKEIRL